jgi:stage II sporulation protein D
MLALLVLLAQTAPDVPTIRVLLRDGATSVTIECPGAIDLRRPKTPKPLIQFGKLTATKIELLGGKFRILDREFDEPWLTFETRREPMKLGERSYRGQFHLVRENGTFKVVNEIDLETYLLGVVGAEIGPGAPFEAMKVQAVAARSYAAMSIDGFPNDGPNRPVWDVHDDTRSQVYVGVATKNSNIERAVRDTAALMIHYKGRIVRTYFSSSCGGHTMGVQEWTGGNEIPPLAGVPCGFCKGAGAWKREFRLGDLAAKFKNRTSGKPVTGLSVKETSRSGRPAVLVLELAGSKAQLSAKDVDAALDLPTSSYTVRREGDTVVLEGAGYGHGVGLCQTGAIGMAQKGWKFDQILMHYFPKAQLAAGYGR